ncbi:hypothetical protein QDX91_004473 [Salmonella enterica]|nr:hypothetical protein [Salmonella enterica subsp. enterica serovar Sandiego]EEC0251697.1 hypothetical protein [Salmonella enterica subsp. enterica]EJW2129038.1 hypothetical protein [Salmonella enterica]EEE4266814.1 hypothetical protein [Salmonella enterica subsp. enterica serovar Sandiego]EKT1704970.1 hypothetical protein [Salmonella enterica]
MIKAPYYLPVHWQPESDEDRHLREDIVERFQVLFSTMSLPSLGATATSTHDSYPVAKSMQTPPPRGDKPTHSAPIQPESLQLRVANGPLAGLIINTGWQGGQLVVRLIAPSASAARHLSRRGKGLEETLSSLLEILVTVKVE